jgi:hypothetical protein
MRSYNRGRGVLFVFVTNAVSGRENLAPVPVKQVEVASSRVEMFAQGESLIRGFIAATILMERPQVDTIRVAFRAASVQPWCMAVRIVRRLRCVSGDCGTRQE